MASNSEKSWDVLSNVGEKLQVKPRVVSDPARAGQLQLFPFRSFGFDFAVIVLLSATRLRRVASVEGASLRGRIFGEAPAACERQGLLCPPVNHGHPDATDLNAALRPAQASRPTVRAT